MKKVIVLDDDEDIAYMVSQILEMNGYECKYQTDHRNFLRKVEDEKPDLLVVDVRLKDGADGREICKQVKAQSSMPVILFSANTDVSINFKDYNADGFIPKPFEVHKLLDMAYSLTAP